MKINLKNKVLIIAFAGLFLLPGFSLASSLIYSESQPITPAMKIGGGLTAGGVYRPTASFYFDGFSQKVWCVSSIPCDLKLRIRQVIGGVPVLPDLLNITRTMATSTGFYETTINFTPTLLEKGKDYIIFIAFPTGNATTNYVWSPQPTTTVLSSYSRGGAGSPNDGVNWGAISSAPYYQGWNRFYGTYLPGGGTPVVSLPGGFSTNLLAYAGQLFTDLRLIVILLLGIPVGFFIIKKSISLVSKRTKTRF